jgi:hypothetical protein
MEEWLASDPPARVNTDDAVAELAHLIAQRPACADLPRTLALLDAHIDDARSRAGLDDVPPAADEAWLARHSQADLKPLRGRSAPVTGWTDDDQLAAHGCV